MAPVTAQTAHRLLSASISTYPTKADIMREPVTPNHSANGTLHSMGTATTLLSKLQFNLLV
jgi:hypothetical protein